MSLGAALVRKGLLTDDDLRRADEERRSTGERLDRALVRLGLASREAVLATLGEEFRLPIIDIDATPADPALLALVPAKLVYKQRCVPVARENGTLTVATSDPYDLAVLDELRLVTGCSIELVLADEDELAAFIRTHYGVGGDTLDELSGRQPAADASAPAADKDEIEQAQEASVIKLVNDLLTEAIAARATDVHVEPYEHELIVRYRIDGVLQRANVASSIHRFGAAIVSRLKIMSNLNIAEKRRPQDGRITFKHRTPRGIEEFDLRVSIIPMLFGEGVVLRVLSKTAALMSLNDLGMPSPMLARWDRLINRPHGILLVTGPTGSGKSTTLYASLNRIISDEIKCITVEDPVEYHVPGVNQIQVNPKVGLDFAAGLRSILRHDPDVVMIGEIRDKETAETAVQASLTGHLVFSTLHTNDSPGATTRLLDMGVEPFLVSSSVEGILAQRLVRRNCAECLERYAPDPADLPEGYTLEPGETHARGKGCKACRGTGFRGRLGVFELLRLTDAVRELIMHHSSARQIALAAEREGELTLLKADGIDKVRAGVTTLPEMLRSLTA